MRSLVIIPTYNEKENIAKIIPMVLFQDPSIEVLVVDDNSTDGTGRIVEELAAKLKKIHIIHRPAKLGLGTAYIEGFKYALKNPDYEYVFEMDADFSHDPAKLPEFLEKIKDFDIVIGSRYHNGRISVVNWPISRLMLSLLANKYVDWVTGLPVSDATTGFKCFRRKVLESIDLDRVHSDGYSFQIEMNYRAWKKGFKIGEIPIVFVDRHSGTSKMSREIVREAFWVVWRLRLGLM